jgi:hypothetical protein
MVMVSTSVMSSFGFSINMIGGHVIKLVIGSQVIS